MSIRAQRISFGLAVLPFVVVTVLSLVLAAAELFIVATAAMAVGFLVIAHVIVSPIASFVAGLEKLGDTAASAEQILAAMPAEPVAVLALAASDAGAALHQVATDATEVLRRHPDEPYATLHELPVRSETQRSAAA
jgi:hypothetical protein